VGRKITRQGCGPFEEKNNRGISTNECTRATSAGACEGAFFDERGAANGVEGASVIFQLYTIASSGVSFLKHQRHLAHRAKQQLFRRARVPRRGLSRYYALLIEEL